jgi:diacylglycerol kinase (ATP)
MEETPMDQPRRFDAFTIIYNPNSTGDALKLAKELHDEWVPQLPGTDVRRVCCTNR